MKSIGGVKDENGVSSKPSEELVEKTLIAITNLPPRKMMEMESCGMLLSAVNNLKDSEDEELHLLMVDDHIPAGAKLY